MSLKKTLSILAIALLAAGCAPSAAPVSVALSESGPAVQQPARPTIAAPYQGQLPVYALKDTSIEAAYRWAATNKAILQWFQCTCGCENGPKGHKSNWNCYVEEEKPGGEYVWDPMSAG